MCSTRILIVVRQLFFHFQDSTIDIMKNHIYGIPKTGQISSNIEPNVQGAPCTQESSPTQPHLNFHAFTIERVKNHIPIISFFNLRIIEDLLKRNNLMPIFFNIFNQLL